MAEGVEAPSRLRKRELFEAIGYRPHPGQVLVHRSTAQRRVLACGARWGKSLCAAMECVAAVLQPCEASRGWVVAPNYDLTQRIFQRVSGTLQTHLKSRVKEINPKERSLTVVNFAGGLSEIRAKSADNPDSLLGESLDWLVIDEAARLNESIWQEHLSQRLIDRRGWALIISTPGAYDHWFYRMFRRGQKGRDPLYESWASASWENPFLSREVIEEERSRLPRDVFSANYEAQFTGIDTHPCDVCGGPDPHVPGMITVCGRGELAKCPECNEPVDQDGHTVVQRWADGTGHVTVLRLEDRTGDEPARVERCYPGTVDAPRALTAADAS